MSKIRCRFAHCEGRTVFSFINDRILTGGIDGDFRIFKNVDDEDPHSESAKGSVLSICSDPKNNRIYAAHEDQTLQVYSFTEHAGETDSLDPEITLTTIKGSVYCMDVVDNKLIAGTSDFSVVLCAFTQNSYKIEVMEGHFAPVLSVSLDYLTEYAASSSCDGSLRIWRLNDLFCELHIADLFKKSNDLRPSNPQFCVQWNNSGSHLAVTLSRCIRLFKRDTWEIDYELENPQNADFSLCCFTFDDRFIVTATLKGTISLWSCGKRDILSFYESQNSSPLCCIGFKSKDYECIFTDYSGFLGVADFTADTEINGFEDWVEDIDILPESSPSAGEDHSDYAEDIVVPTRHRNSNVNLSSDDSSNRPSIQEDKEQPAFEDHIGVMQPPFQSGSTPSFLSERYMVWNSIGIVKQYSQRSESSDSIDVEFHDTSISHSFHIDNSHLYSIGDLSESALLLASNGDDSEDSIPSKIYCILTNTWDRCKEWSVEMTEKIHCVTLSSSNWLAVVTSRRLVRIFTLSGLEVHVFSIPGQGVCSISSNSRLFVVYHRGLAKKGDQALGFLLYEISMTSVFPLISSSDLPISSDSVLRWAGFSEHGRVFTCDSKGITRCMFILETGGHWWGEVCDVSGTLDDNNWVVGVDEQYQRVRYISSRFKYVPLFPKPVVIFMNFQLPLTQSTLQQTKFQEGIIRSNMFSSYSGDESSLAMQLIALLCKDKMDRRAFDVIKLLLERPVSRMSTIFGSLALKYAERSGHPSLAKNIADLIDSNSEVTETNESLVVEDVPEIMAPRTVRLSTSRRVNPPGSPNYDTPSVVSESFMSQATVDESIDGRLESSSLRFNPFKTDREGSSANVDCFNKKVRRACDLEVQVPTKRQKKASAFEMWVSETGNVDSKSRSELLADFSKLSSDEKKFWKDKAK